MAVPLPARIKDGLYEITETKARHDESSSLTVDDLHRLYRQWPLRPSNHIIARVERL